MSVMPESSRMTRKFYFCPANMKFPCAQSGYMDFTEKVVVEPRKKVVLHVTMQKTKLSPGSITQAGPSIKKD
jgi:hypothetical protein